MDSSLDMVRSCRDSPLAKNVPASNTTICNSVAVELGRYLKALGLEGASVLQAAGLKRQTLSERHSRFPAEQLAAALQISARHTNDPFFGLHFGAWYRPRVLNACNYAINSAPDLHNALISVQVHNNFVAGIPTQLSARDSFTELSWNIELATSSLRHLIDFKTMRLLKHIQQSTGPEWRPLRVNLVYQKPENEEEYFRSLGPNIHFDQPVNSIRIEAEILAIPMPDADPDIYHMACNSLKNPFASTRETEKPIDQFLQFIHGQLGKKNVTMASASKHLLMTQQQLRRLLKKHGTCFQCALKEARKAHAAHYLCETETRFSEITYLLGFSDQSTFSRAIKRWFGTTPRDMRRDCD